MNKQRLEIGNAVRYADAETGEEYTGRIVGISRRNARVVWDDGNDPSWINLSKLEQIA